MSAPTLTVARLSATVQLDREQNGSTAAQRIGAVQQRVARDELARAWSQATVPAGRWCIRRLAVPLEMNLNCPDSSLARQWSDAIMASVSRLLRDQPAEVVHYSHDLDALADAVAELAAGHRERAWAWAQAGVLQPGDPAPPAMPGPAILAVLGHRPELAVAVLAEAARRRGVAALDRALGRSGWQQAAQLAWAASSGTHVPRPPTASATGSATGHVVGLLATSILAAEIARSRLAPTEPTRRAWTALVALEVDASIPRRAGAPALLAAVDAALAQLLREHRMAQTGGEDPPGPPSSAGPAVRPGDVTGPGPNGSTAGGVARPDGAGREPSADHAQQSPARRQLSGLGSASNHVPGRWARGTEQGAADNNPVPAGRNFLRSPGHPLPEPATGLGPAGVPTGFAGLPFLLATAAESGVPARLLDDPAFALRPVRWCVHTVAQLMSEAPADDPGLLALTGLNPSRADALRSAPSASDEELARLIAVARDWALVTVARLVAASADPAADGLGPEPGGGDLLARVVRRRGRVTAQPGWIEVHLPVDSVDLAVRRAGLDIDPGWIDWLGAVVRYVYA